MSYKDKNYIEKLKELQQSMPNINLPTMGLINNDTKISINSSDYIKESGEK